MVVSVAKATSAEYYTGSAGMASGAASYYLDAVQDGEPAGQWSGAGAEALGLHGEVDAQDMQTLYSTFTNPTTGLPVGSPPKQHKSVEERLADAIAAEPDALPERIAELRSSIERSDRHAVIGWDATFSVPKSVTVAHTAAHRAELAAIRSEDPARIGQFRSIRLGIESAIRDANQAMLDHAATIATARAGRHGGHSATGRWEAAPGLTVASFFQHTSRNIDPQLHVHNVVLNRAVCADGVVRALDGADLLAQRHALGAVADRALDEALVRLGFEVELRPDGQARELTIVPPEVADLFSSRSRQIGARVAELAAAAQTRVRRELTDLELHRLKQAATLATRAAKHAHAPESTEEMLDRWWATTVGVGSDLDRVGTAIAGHLNEDARAERAAEGPLEWSAEAVVAEAVAALGEQRSTWGAADLMLELHRRLPSLGGLTPSQTTEVLTRLTQEALSGPLVQQVSGRADEALAQIDALSAAEAVAADPFTRPSARTYASRHTIVGEEALRRAAVERGGRKLTAEAVAGWLEEHAAGIGLDQREAVVGLATTDARLTMLIGPAGAGKSFAAGALAHAWEDLTHGEGRVVGLAVSQIATEVLRDDGIAASRNITSWLGVQERLANHSTRPDDTAWRLKASDVVMVDEASMISTADLQRIQDLVDAAGARMILTGDPRQLGAVEAGGVMELLDGHAETYTLAEVRRFRAEWEPDASLALRDGDLAALSEYDRRGRISAYESLDDAHRAVARAAVADRLDGRSVVVIASSNDEAAKISTRIRDQLSDLGIVDTNGPSTLLGRDQCVASAGDLIVARRNDYARDLTNRQQYRVLAVGEDGSITAAPADQSGSVPVSQGQVHIPAAYVSEHVQLGYAATAHGAQGVTVDAAHLVTDGTLDAAGLYVAMTRGRQRNTAHVATTPAEKELADRFRDTTIKSSGRSVLEGVLERQRTNRAALVEAELDAERLQSADILTGRLESVVRSACRERLDRHLDQLTSEGALRPEARARLGVEQGTEHLSRLLRAVELSGADPQHALREAVGRGRGLHDAQSISQVLAHRIAAGEQLPLPADDATQTRTPADIAPQASEHIELLQRRLDERGAALGRRTVERPPAWAREALGPVPKDDAGRAEWEKRAGAVAAHREAIGLEDPNRALDVMPGLANNERRLSHTRAWLALGRPEAGLGESAMSDGQLRVRITAGKQAKAWAPPHADEALRAAELKREQARQAAALARADADRAKQNGDVETAERHLAAASSHEQQADMTDAATRQLSRAAEARSAWAARSLTTLDAEERARDEAKRRGLALDAEPDRMTSGDWLRQERRARAAEDAHRQISETDLVNEDDDHPTDDVARDQTGDDATAQVEAELARVVIPVDASPAQLELHTASAALWLAREADFTSQEAAHAHDDREDTEANRRRREHADDLDAARAAAREDHAAAGLSDG